MKRLNIQGELMKVNLLSKIATSNTGKKYVNWALKKNVSKNGKESVDRNYDKLQKFFPTFLMAWLSTVQCCFWLKSHEMKKERKIPLLINEGYTGLMGVTLSFMINKKVTKLTKTLSDRAEIIYKDANKAKLKNGLNTAIPAAITTVLFQYICPVIATPLATQTTKYLSNKGIINLSDKKSSK